MLIALSLVGLIIGLDRFDDENSFIQAGIIFENLKMDYGEELASNVAEYIKNARDKESLTFLKLIDLPALK